MLSKQQLIKTIADLEWKMFRKVKNRCGRSSCQENPAVFRIMREAQAGIWSAQTLSSYSNDLISASQKGRNLMEEKYAWMMEHSSPEEFLFIKRSLPDTDPEAKELINDISAHFIIWAEELDRRFPMLHRRGRPLRTGAQISSVEDYLCAELRTYSTDTLRLCRADVSEAFAEGRNLAQENLTAIVRAYGYASLEQAEARLNG